MMNLLELLKLTQQSVLLRKILTELTIQAPSFSTVGENLGTSFITSIFCQPQFSV